MILSQELNNPTIIRVITVTEMVKLAEAKYELKKIYEVDENYFQIDQLKRKAFGQFLLLFESNTNCESNHVFQQIMNFFFNEM